MSSTVRTATLLGVLLVLIGVVAGASGGYQVATNQCHSGYKLAVDQSDSTTDAQPVDFATLSPTDQRIFLEAFTASPQFSRTYGSPAPFENLTRTRVQYRNRTYVTNTVAVDCGAPPGLYTALGGGLSLLLGLASFLFAVAITLRSPSERE